MISASQFILCSQHFLVKQSVSYLRETISSFIKKLPFLPEVPYVQPLAMGTQIVLLLVAYDAYMCFVQDKLYQWIMRKHEEGSRITVADIVCHIQVIL